MLRFFVPGAASEAEAERLLASMAEANDVPDSNVWPRERVFSIRYTLRGVHYVAAVGNPILSYGYPNVPLPDRDGIMRWNENAPGLPPVPETEGSVVAALLVRAGDWLICLVGPDAACGRVLRLEREAVDKVDWFEN